MRGVRTRGFDWAVHTAAALFIAATIAVSGCVHHHPAAAPSVHAHRHGPPPHAPAHGYRHKHHRDGVELAFDSGLGVYVVVDWPGHYWYVDRYVRWSDGHWSASARVDGGWIVIGSDEIPARLVAKHSRHPKRAKRSKHGHPARHAD